MAFIAKKANRSQEIQSGQVDQFARLGFDIWEDGKIFKYGVGNSVSRETFEQLQKDHAKALDQIERLVSLLPASKMKDVEVILGTETLQTEDVE